MIPFTRTFAKESLEDFMLNPRSKANRWNTPFSFGNVNSAELIQNTFSGIYRIATEIVLLIKYLF